MKTSKRKKEIISVAAKLFKEKGYAAVSMRDIAGELGIKAASLYNHILSKQEILSLIIIEIAEDFTQHIATVFPKNNSAAEKLAQIIHMHIDITVEKTNSLACTNNDWMHLDPEQLNYYIQMRNDYEDKFRKIILEGIKNNELREQDPEVILFSLLSTLRTFYLWYSKRNSLSTTQLTQEMTATLLHGVIR